MANYKRKKMTITRKHKDAATKKRERRFLIVFATLLVIVAMASTITMIKEKNKERDDPDAPESEITLVGDKTRKSSIGIMFAAVSPDNEVLYVVPFIFDSTTKSYTIQCLNPPKNADPNKPAELLASVNQTYGLKLDRYVLITREQFKEFTQILGGYEITLKSRVDYSDNNFAINLAPGERKLYGNQFFDYLRFIGLSGSDHERQSQAEILVDYVKQKLNKELVSNGDDVFSRLANTCTTDITIVDFTKYQPLIEESVAKRLKISVVDVEKDK